MKGFTVTTESAIVVIFVLLCMATAIVVLEKSARGNEQLVKQLREQAIGHGYARWEVSDSLRGDVSFVWVVPENKKK